MALTDQLRRLKVDYYEYIALKVIVLLSSNGGESASLSALGASSPVSQLIDSSAIGRHFPVKRHHH